jgi:hypothetical protein
MILIIIINIFIKILKYFMQCVCYDIISFSLRQSGFYDYLYVL